MLYRRYGYLKNLVPVLLYYKFISEALGVDSRADIINW